MKPYKIELTYLNIAVILLLTCILFMGGYSIGFVDGRNHTGYDVGFTHGLYFAVTHHL